MKVLVVMGSANDAEKLKAAGETLAAFGVEHEVWAMSAHRNAEKVRSFVGSARENGFGVIIAAAGMAAHLAGACAANTTLPVIGIPVSSGSLNGVDALYSTVQMPPGMPVATVAVDGAKNAALLAIQILAV
ncbi:MAG: 5-(carboxyamino)imidazole ribonucleotide mutase, partial [Actinomycetota bacterium]|nr:5-(carboxyamino)imidazole ribonucleotide mutase [Actinomycetota bacterium]